MGRYVAYAPRVFNPMSERYEKLANRYVRVAAEEARGRSPLYESFALEVAG